MIGATHGAQQDPKPQWDSYLVRRSEGPLPVGPYKMTPNPRQREETWYKGQLDFVEPPRIHDLRTIAGFANITSTSS